MKLGECKARQCIQDKNGPRKCLDSFCVCDAHLPIIWYSCCKLTNKEYAGAPKTYHCFQLMFTLLFTRSFRGEQESSKGRCNRGAFLDILFSICNAYGHKGEDMVLGSICRVCRSIAQAKSCISQMVSSANPF